MKVKDAGIMTFSYFMGALACVGFGTNTNLEIIGYGVFALVGFFIILVNQGDRE